MKLNIAATKTNLLIVKRSLELTREGYELLDEKRKILINELNAVIDIAENLESDLNKMLKDAYATIDRAVVVMGRSRAESLHQNLDFIFGRILAHATNRFIRSLSDILRASF